MADAVDRGERNYAGFARFRIVGWVMLLTTMGLAAAGAAVVVVEADRIDRRADRNIQQEFDEAERLRTIENPQNPTALDSAEEFLRALLEQNVPKRHEVYLGVLDGEARFVSNGPETNFKVDLARDPAFLAAVDDLGAGGFGSIDTDDGEVRLGVLGIEQGGEIQAAYVVAYFTDPWRGQFVDVMSSYATVAILTLLLVAVGAWLVAGRLLRPVHQLESAAREITESDLTQRLEAEGRGELSGLAETFNSMLDRLSAAFEVQREFLDDAGHELATPITILRGHLELMDQDDATEVDATRAMLLDELDRMSRLVGDLVTLAKTDRPDFLQIEEFELSTFTRDVHRLCSGLDDRDWVLDQTGSGPVVGDPQRLTQALLQLASNAVRYSGPGRPIALGSDVGVDGFRLWVRDQGPGVAPDEAEKVFARFARGSGVARGEGSGLGLAIVQAIAEAHDGTVRLDSPPEGGATFVLDLPAGRQPSLPAGHGEIRAHGAAGPQGPGPQEDGPERDLAPIRS